MTKLATFEQFLATNNANISIESIVLALLLAAFLSFILGRIYIRYGEALSNRRKFASIFIPLSTTTTLIIMIVKSSLALSLGLVGALSIVRFRAAIKEPEELVFLFLAISIGLGLGANQFFVTTIAFIIICILLRLRAFSKIKQENQNLSLVITGKPSEKVNLKRIINLLKIHCSSVHLKRFDSTNETLEAAFLVSFNSFYKLEEVKKELENLSKSIHLIYLDRE